MHTVFALLCFVVVIHWLIFPYPSGLLHWHCGNLTIAPVPAKQPWCIWINTSCEFIMNDCITTTKQSTTKPCAYFLGYTVREIHQWLPHTKGQWYRAVVSPLLLAGTSYWINSRVAGVLRPLTFLWRHGNASSESGTRIALPLLGFEAGRFYPYHSGGHFAGTGIRLQ